MNYRKTILHVDDDPQMTRLVANRLTPLGYEVTSLNEPSRALEMVTASDPRVILLDVDMPGVNGIDLLQEIKRACGGSQVIMLTGQVSIQTLLHSYRSGAEFCIFKPLTDVAPLRTAIETVFRKIDHWWNAMSEMSRQRHDLMSAEEQECSLPIPKIGTAAAAAPSQREQ